MSYLHLSQSSNSEEKPTPTNGNSILNFKNELGTKSKINSESDLNIFDSFRRHNSLLFNRTQKAFMGEEKMEAGNVSEINNWFTGFEKGFENNADNLEKEKPESQPGEKAAKNQHADLILKDSGFRFLRSNAESPTIDLWQREKGRGKDLNFIKLVDVDDPFNLEDKSPGSEHLGLENMNQNELAMGLAMSKSIKPKKYKTDLIKGLEMFLFRMFTQKAMFPKDYNLNRQQEEILQAILQRKFGKRLTKEQLMLPAMKKTELINKFLNSSCKKRPEECYKFFLIRIIKNLKGKITNQQNNPMNDDDEEFYQFYFSEIAQKNGLTLQEFYYPFNRKAEKNSKLNSKYFEKLKLSQRFLADANEYLCNETRKEHAAEVQQKLFSLLKPHDQFIRKRKKTEEKCMKDLVSYIEGNKHCKFPWTVKEQEESMEKFKGVIFDR